MPGLATLEGRICSAGPLAPPNSVAVLESMPVAKVKEDYSHTQWINGVPSQSGFTTLFGPNTKIRFGRSREVNWINAEVLLTQKSPCNTEKCSSPQQSYHPHFAIPARALTWTGCRRIAGRSNPSRS